MKLPFHAKSWLCLAWILYAGLALAPLALVTGSAFFDGGGPTLAHFRELLRSSRPWTLLANSLALGVGSAVGAMLLGVPLGFLLARTDLPLRRVMAVLAVVPILIPPYIYAIALTYRVTLWGLWGGIAIFSLAYHPLGVFFAAKGFRTLSSGMEESGRVSGMPWRTYVRVTGRLALPSILAGGLLVFVFTISDFAIPDYLFFTSDRAFQVFSSEIFAWWNRFQKPQTAAAAGLPIVALAVLALVTVRRLHGSGVISAIGGGFRSPSVIRLGHWRWPAAAACGAFLSVAVLYPLAVLVWKAGPPATYLKALGQAGAEWRNSMAMAGVATTALTILAAALAYSVTRSGGWRAGIFEVLALLPLAFPALYLAVGMIRFWNRPWPIFDAVYTGAAVVVIAFVARFTSIAFFAVRSSLERIDPLVEEAGIVAGRGWGASVVRLLAPLGARGVATAWIVGFVFCARELDAIVLLRAGNETLPVRIFNMVHYSRDELVAALCVVMVVTVGLPLVLAMLVAPRRIEVV